MSEPKFGILVYGPEGGEIVSLEDLLNAFGEIPTEFGKYKLSDAFATYVWGPLTEGPEVDGE